jgi:hypothetical protein
MLLGETRELKPMNARHLLIALSIAAVSLGVCAADLRPGGVFLEGGLARQQTYSVTAGIRIYFGADKPLIRRHREDGSKRVWLADRNLAQCAIPGARLSVSVSHRKQLRKMDRADRGQRPNLRTPWRYEP